MRSSSSHLTAPLTRFIPALLFVTLLLFALPALPAGASVSFSGTGTEDDPYLITDNQDLYTLATAAVEEEAYNSGGVYYRVSDAFTNRDEPYPGPAIGSGGRAFAANFDGNHRTVYLDMNDDAADTAGLFGHVDESGIIRNLHTAGSVAISTITGYAGGIAGVSGGRIVNCSSAAAVAGGEDAMLASIGGLAGINNGSVENCFTSGEVSGGNWASLGGLVGMNLGDIANCYAAAAVSGGTATNGGGLIGADGAAGGVLLHNYYLQADSGLTAIGGVSPDPDGAGGKTLAEMQMSAFTDLLNSNRGDNPEWAVWYDDAVDNPLNLGLPQFIAPPPDEDNDGGENSDEDGNNEDNRDDEEENEGPDPGPDPPSPAPNDGGENSIRYRVRLESGDAISVIRVRDGGKLAPPDDPQRDGYLFTGWYLDAALHRAYDFSRPVYRDFTLYAGWQPVQPVLAAAPQASDIDGHWAATAIRPMVARGLISCYPDGSFRPDAPILRGEFLALAMSALGGTTVNTDATAQFPDVAAHAFYGDALLQARALGIAAGDIAGNFHPEQRISRQDMFVLAYRALAALVALPEVYSQQYILFSDGGDLAAYAAEAVQNLAKLGLLRGSGGALNPLGLATRAEATQFLANVLAYLDSRQAAAQQ